MSVGKILENKGQDVANGQRREEERREEMRGEEEQTSLYHRGSHKGSSDGKREVEGRTIMKHCWSHRI